MMKLSTLRFMSLIIFLLLFWACQPTYINLAPEINVEGPYKHKFLPIQFPENIFDFNRGRITKYSEDEKDISVGYNIRSIDKDITFTVYLTATSMYELTKQDTLQQIINDSKVSLDYYYKDIEIISDNESKFKGIYPGRIMVFKLKHPERSEFSYSELHLYKISDWLMKFRISYPVDQKLYIENDINRIIREIEKYYLLEI